MDQQHAADVIVAILTALFLGVWFVASVGGLVISVVLTVDAINGPTPFWQPVVVLLGAVVIATAPFIWANHR